MLGFFLMLLACVLTFPLTVTTRTRCSTLWQSATTPPQCIKVRYEVDRTNNTKAGWSNKEYFLSIKNQVPSMKWLLTSELFPSEPDPSDRPSEARDNYREPGRSYYGSIHQIEKREDGYHPRLIHKRDDGYHPRLMYKREDGYHPGIVYDPFNPWGDHQWSPPTIREDTTVSTTVYRSNNYQHSTTQYTTMCRNGLIKCVKASGTIANKWESSKEQAILIS